MNFFPNDLLHYLNDPMLRWQDNSQGQQVLLNALRFPKNESLQRRAMELVRRRLIHAQSLNNPFYGKYPSPGQLPSARGRLSIIALPTGDSLSYSVKDTRSHTLVTGATGRGKSMWLRGFILQALQTREDLNIIVFDRKGTLDLVDSATLLNSGCQVNVFNCMDIPIAPLQKPDEKISDSHWANVLVSLFSSSWNLIASTNLLLEVTHELFRNPEPRTWNKLLGSIVSWIPKSRRSLEYKDVLERNFKATQYALGDAINASKSNVIELITRGSRVCNVICIDDLPDIVACLYPALFLFADYEHRKANEEAREKTNIYILDDSMGLLRRESTYQNDGTSISPLDTMVFMSRAFGIALVVSVQNISQTSKFYCQNANTIVCAGAVGDDLHELQSLMNLSDEETFYLGSLTRREGEWAEVAAVCRSVWPHCLLGRYPYIE